MSSHSVAIAIMVKNEEKRIKTLLDSLYGTDADKIYFFGDYSSDKTIEIIEDIRVRTEIHSTPISVFKNISSKEAGFGQKKNTIHKMLRVYDWVLHIDADEKFDRHFIENIKLILSTYPSTLSFAFPRVNLPDAKNYPDCQVRLLRVNSTRWEGEIHEKAYDLRGEPLFDRGQSIQKISENGLYYCIVLDRIPIIHYERRTDIKRSWW